MYLALPKMLGAWSMAVFRGGSRGGGLRVLKHPPKLPKIYYLLLNIVD